MKKLFAIALLAFGLTAHAQQPQQTAKAVAPESLVGKFTGTYVNPRLNVTIGAELVIKTATGDKVQGSFSTYRRNCRGALPAEGTMDGKMLHITVKSADFPGCVDGQIQLSISDDGNKLNGEMLDSVGTVMPIRLTR